MNAAIVHTTLTSFGPTLARSYCAGLFTAATLPTAGRTNRESSPGEKKGGVRQVDVQLPDAGMQSLCRMRPASAAAAAAERIFGTRHCTASDKSAPFYTKVDRSLLR